MMTTTKWTMVASLIAGLAACGSDQQHQSQAPQLVQTITLDTPQHLLERRFNGQVAVAELTRMAFRIEGKMVSLAVLPGQEVQQGQILARLDDTIQRQQLEDATAQQQLLQKQWERASKLLGKGLMAQSDFDEIDANLRLARVSADSAKAQLSYTELRAPFNGIVDTLEQQAHETTAPGETVLTLYRSDRIDVEIQLPDTLLSHAISFSPTMSYQPKVTLKGQAEAIPMRYLEHSLRLDPQTGAYVAKLALDHPQWQVLPGEAAEVSIDLKAAGLPVTSGYRLPLTALQATDAANRFQIWRVRGETAEPTTVEVAQMSQEGALVMGALAGGDRIITSGLAKLRPNKAVTVVNKD